MIKDERPRRIPGGLVAIEYNVGKLIADRTKKRGMSWSKRGADRMARLISLIAVPPMQVMK